MTTDEDNNNNNSNNSTSDKDDGTSMTTDERLQWLRERGVLVETPEERRAKEIKSIMNEPDDIDFISNSTKNTNDDDKSIAFVMIPHDTSQPLQQMQFKRPNTTATATATATGDALMEHLKPIFQSLSRDKHVDIELLRTNAIHTLGSSSLTTEIDPANTNTTTTTTTATAPPPMVSTKALEQVAAEGGVETFALVHPTESNHYTGITIYLDEIGMLKRLPLNTRAIEYCALAGYNPPPQLYGTVFLSRVKKVYPTRGGSNLQYQDFLLGTDTHKSTATWLQRAVMDNLQYQTEMNALTGRTNVTQAAVDGTDGTEKKEDGYTWTQTEEEVEVLVPIPVVNDNDGDDDNDSSHHNTVISSRDINIKFMPQKITIHYSRSGTGGGSSSPMVQLDLFERVDPDGCTWTLDRNTNVIVVTMEKMEPALWPRIKD